MCGPLPRTMKRGVPPTALNARTGEFTPPGVTPQARSKSASDTGAACGYARRVVLASVTAHSLSAPIPAPRDGRHCERAQPRGHERRRASEREGRVTDPESISRLLRYAGEIADHEPQVVRDLARWELERLTLLLKQL